ncbi:REP element-mobilizing transposase RayT [Pseudomonas brassicacearum]|uniref:REP element-mobilizing transposase RayT n=1 Tax=Pseudomonas brassicacearum TaxID=930166 RepID=A0AAW8MFH7_9PSED|nr:REP element-mobilizing transposase RayT [Pseudomonas brassicacearum]
MPDLPASHRLRIGRYGELNRIYLLTTNTIDRIPVFQDFALGKLVVDQFRYAQDMRWAKSLAWVVMPDHFHWLIELQQSSLNKLMQKTKSLSTRAVNLSTGRRGSLWQQGYHDRALRREEGLVRLARYVVANPLRARLVKRLGDYPLWDAIWVRSEVEVPSSRASSLPHGISAAREI